MLENLFAVSFCAMINAKIFLIELVWVLLAAILVLQRIAVMRGRATARMTIVAFLLILFAIVGTSVFCGTKHDFTRNDTKAAQVGK